MKVFVLHGEDTVKSKAKLNVWRDSARRRGWEIVVFDEKTPHTSVINSLRMVDLFGKEKFFIFYGTNRLTSNDLKSIYGAFSKLQGNIVFYFPSTLTPRLLKGFKDARIDEFKLPKVIYKFVESIYPTNYKESVKFLSMLLVKEPPEKVFYHLARQLKNLYWATVAPNTLPYPSWISTNLKTQAKKFTKDRLINLIRVLADFDTDVKTGKITLNSLDLLLTTQLQ